MIAFDVISFKLKNDINSSNTVNKFELIIGIVGLKIMSPLFVLNLNS